MAPSNLSILNLVKIILVEKGLKIAHPIDMFIHQLFTYLIVINKLEENKTVI